MHPQDTTLTISRENILSQVPLAAPAVCIMLGIVVGDNHLTSGWPLSPVALLLITLAVTVATGRWSGLQSTGIMGCFLLLGVVVMERAERKATHEFDHYFHKIAAVVTSEPTEKEKTMAMDIVLPQQQRKMKCYVEKDDRSRQISVGDELILTSRIYPNSEWRKGTFDYSRYLTIHGYSGRVYAPATNWQRSKVEGLSARLRITRWFLRQRQRLLSTYRERLTEDDTYAIVAAMTLGDKSAITDRLRQTYAVTGVSHVLALSGLHLSVVYGIISLLLAGRRQRVVGTVATIAAVWAFVMLTGMQVSVVRSATMISVYAILSLLRRQALSVNTLALTAIIMLLYNPYTLFDVGFQLSFASVLAILLTMPLLERMLPPHYMQRHRVTSGICSLLMVSVAAQTGTAPLVAYYFGRLPVYFLITNLVTIPAVTAILYLSLATWLLPQVTVVLAWVAAMLNKVLQTIAQWPHASVDDLHPSVLQVVMWYVVIGCVMTAADIVTRNARRDLVPTSRETKTR